MALVGGRTIRLPDDLDHLVDELGLDLSQMVQDLIRELVVRRTTERTLRLVALRQRSSAMAITYPPDHLRSMRAEVGDDRR